MGKGDRPKEWPVRSALPSRVPKGLGRLALGVTLFFWVVAVGVPIGAVAARAGGLSAVLDPALLAVVRFTAKQAFLSTLVSVGLGLPLGLWLGRARGRAVWAEAFLGIPFVIPTVVAGTAWVIWLGRTGWLAQALSLLGLPSIEIAYSFKAVILAHVFYNVPWIALAVGRARVGVPAGELEGAQLLGAGVFARLRWVIWPYLRWELGSASAQVFAVCSMSFALVLILGGGPPVETLETALYARVRYGTLDLEGAAACALWEMLLTLLPWAMVLALRSRDPGSRVKVAQGGGRERDLNRMSHVALGGLAFVFILPYLAFFVPGADGFVLSHLLGSEELRSEVARPLGVSLLLSVCVCVATLFVTVCALLAESLVPSRLKPGIGILLALPGGVSVLALGLGVWLAYGQWVDPFGGSLLASFLALVGVQVAVLFPLAYRALWPVGQACDRAAWEAALMLGASPVQAFRYSDWPRWRPALLSVAGLLGGLAIGEVAAASLFSSEELVPLPMIVSRWMGQFKFEQAQAVAGLLACLAVVWVFAARILATGLERAGRMHG